MNDTLSQRVQNIKPSPTLAMNTKAAELKAQGKDIISLGVGEPDFDTPKHILDAAKQALDEGYTRYTAVDGFPELKQAIIDKFKHDNDLSYQLNEILVSCGAKHSLYNLFQALINPGDEVIIPAPYWVSYPDMVALAGGEPVVIGSSLEQDYKITAEQLAETITAKTKALIINSPSNPSGSTYTKAELSALGEVLRSHPQVWIVTDDIYEHILWADEPFANIVNACPDLKDRTLVINGVSKAYAMTGLRIGYSAGDSKIIGAMKKIQSQSTSNPCSISQMAAKAALTGDQSSIKQMVTKFKHRHDMVLKALSEIPGVESRASSGTFYIFPRFKQAMEKLGISSDTDLASHLLDAGVATVPGSAFGMPGYLRLSYAASDEALNKAIDRINNALA